MILKMLHKSTWHRLQTSQHRCKNGQLKENQTEWRTLWFKWVFCSFVDFCHKNSKLIVRAVERNSLSSLLECREKQFILTLGESICHHTGHHFICPGKSKSRSDGIWMTWCKHLVSQAPSKGQALCGIFMWCATHKSNPWLTAGCHNQGLQSLVCLDLTLSKHERSLW